MKLAQTSNPVDNPPFNNWSTNQPSPPHIRGMENFETLGVKDMIVDGINFDLVQTGSKVTNPVDNPPYNNWSVNQPSPPHDIAYEGNEDYGQNYIIDGHRVHY
jgi:hypothetical protein